MERNKFDDFYAKSPATLFEEIRLARLNPNPADEAWWHNIVNHLNQRKLTDEEKKTMHQILTVDDDTLKRDYNFEEDINSPTAITNATSSEISEIWYHSWWTFMFTVTLSVCIGMLIAAYIISIILKNNFNNAFQ